MSAKLLTEHLLGVLSLKETAEARLSLHLSKCHIVGNHMPRLTCVFHHILQAMEAGAGGPSVARTVVKVGNSEREFATIPGTVGMEI